MDALDSESDEDVSEELFGTNINLLNTDDASESEASGEEGDGTSASAIHGCFSDEIKRQVVADIVELNKSAGDWKVNGFKCRKKPLEVFLHSLGLSFLLQSLLEANVCSTQVFSTLAKKPRVSFWSLLALRTTIYTNLTLSYLSMKNQVGQTSHI